MAEATKKAVSARMSVKLREVFGPEDGEDFADLLRAVTAQNDDLNARIDALELGLGAKIDALDKNLSTRISDVKSDLMKWSFVFWVSAVAAIAALAGVLRN